MSECKSVGCACSPAPLATVVAWLRQHTRVPVLTGLPFGHVPTKVALPVGAKVALAVEGRDALMLWGHIH